MNGRQTFYHDQYRTALDLQMTDKPHFLIQYLCTEVKYCNKYIRTLFLCQFPLFGQLSATTWSVVANN